MFEQKQKITKTVKELAVINPHYLANSGCIVSCNFKKLVALTFFNEDRLKIQALESFSKQQILLVY